MALWSNIQGLLGRLHTLSIWPLQFLATGNGWGCYINTGIKLNNKGLINQYIHVHVLIHGVTFKVHAYTCVYISIHIVHRQFNKLKIYQIILRWVLQWSNKENLQHNGKLGWMKKLKEFNTLNLTRQSI